mmetsp:Transcript_13821/g.37078  ORF Transcript_13821/g.37078 Transcript_13821/m.37078 type:complete len:202 (+) Transcript_13821:807-1412(+)
MCSSSRAAQARTSQSAPWSSATSRATPSSSPSGARPRRTLRVARATCSRPRWRASPSGTAARWALPLTGTCASTPTTLSLQLSRRGSRRAGPQAWCSSPAAACPAVAAVAAAFARPSMPWRRSTSAQPLDSRTRGVCAPLCPSSSTASATRGTRRAPSVRRRLPATTRRTGPARTARRTSRDASAATSRASRLPTPTVPCG